MKKSGEIITSRDAIVYISKRIAPGMLRRIPNKKCRNIIRLGIITSSWKKSRKSIVKRLYFWGKPHSKLIELKLGWIDNDDKDHYGNKVIKFAGQMLS